MTASPTQSKRFKRPDYFVTQIPGGGQRGYASALLLDYFEEKNGLPSYQLFPNISVASVGILIAAGLYLPHPDDPRSPCMTAKQVVDVFPSIAATLPKSIAFLKNGFNRTPYENGLRAYIGHGKLKDLMGTVFLSCHQISAVENSYELSAKIIDPVTGETTYLGDENANLLDIALSGTAIPSVFAPHQGRLDLAFSDVGAVAMARIKSLHPNEMQGAFIRLGNFRNRIDKSRTPLESGGFLHQTRHLSVNGAVSDQTFSQTIQLASALFGGSEFVYNLEQVIPPDYVRPPRVEAHISTAEQFKRIRDCTSAFIEENNDMMDELADILGEQAIARQRMSADSTFLSRWPLKEHNLPKPPAIEQYPPALQSIGESALRLAKGFLEAAGYAGKETSRGLVHLATREPVVDAFRKAGTFTRQGLASWDRKLFPKCHPIATDLDSTFGNAPE